jgi:hypothetical protein
MFRDDVLKRLIHAKTNNPAVDTKAQNVMIEGIRTAKAVRLDQEALALINNYSNEIGEQGSWHVLRNTPVSWPVLWLEHDEFDENGDLWSFGALFIQDDESKLCISFMKSPDPDKQGYGNFRDIICSHKTLKSSPEDMTVHSSDNHLKVENDMIFKDADAVAKIMVRTTLRLMERATVLSTLLLNSHVLTLDEAQRTSKPKSASFKKAGETAPTHRVQKINLTELGRRMYRMRVLGETESVGGTSGKRRAHWVRDHMFVARNGLLTYRKAHVRGMGKLRGGEAVVVAPEETETPGF